MSPQVVPAGPVDHTAAASAAAVSGQAGEGSLSSFAVAGRAAGQLLVLVVVVEEPLPQQDLGQ